MLSRFPAAAAIALALAACGERSGEDVANEWVEALNDGDWKRACELSLQPDDDCERELRGSFDGGRVSLLPPRAYANGDRTNDNETTFAVEIERAEATSGFLEIIDDRVALEVLVDRAR